VDSPQRNCPLTTKKIEKSPFWHLGTLTTHASSSTIPHENEPHWSEPYEHPCPDQNAYKGNQPLYICYSAIRQGMQCDIPDLGTIDHKPEMSQHIPCLIAE
jgi:hypothetical protein